MDIFALLTVAGVAAFLLSLSDSPYSPSIKARMDTTREALREVEELKRRLYAELKAEKNQQRRNEIAALLAEEKEASERLRDAYNEIRAEYDRAQQRLASQRQVREIAFERLKPMQEEKNKARNELSQLFEAIRPHREDLSQVFASAKRGHDVYDFGSRISRAKSAIADLQSSIDRQKGKIADIDRRLSSQREICNRETAAFDRIKWQIFG